MTPPARDSLVIYKKSPARVVSIQMEFEGQEETKVEIQFSNGKTRKVREKGIAVLHPGPCFHLADLDRDSPEGNPAEAWELLQGESAPSFSELAELIYGEYSPASSWATFKLLNRSPWFRGVPEAIEINDEDTVNSIIRERKKKEENERRWTDFMERLQAGKIDLAEDEIFLRDLEMCATGRNKGSRILKALGLVQNPGNAHRFMIKHNIKPLHWNPHPRRLELPMDIPCSPTPALPQESRLDLCYMEAFAIDDEGNQDPDDAISWDGSRLWVHIADVAGIVNAGSEIDKSAMDRASSLYLPEVTIPMLPPDIVRILGLGLVGISPALSYEIEIDMQGEITHCAIHLSMVKVQRLTYNEAEHRMDEEPFRSIEEVCGRFRAKRVANGARRIDMPEVKIHATADGDVTIAPLPALASREMVSECMIIAGSAAANWCLGREIPIAFVRQEAGQQKDNADAGQASQVSQTSQASQNGTEGIDSSKDAAHAPIPGVSPPYPEQYKLRSGMKRSSISVHQAPHAALGLPAYTRITSPLRRYADLVVSRQIRNTLLNRPIQKEEEVSHIIAASEARIVSLVQAERRSNLFWKIVWLMKHHPWRGRAILLDCRENKGYFLIPELALEVWVRMKQQLSAGQHVSLCCRETDLAESMAVFVIKEVLDDP